MAKFEVTLDQGDPMVRVPAVTVEAERCETDGGSVSFYSTDDQGIYTVCAAYGPGTWKQVRRVDG